MEYPSGVSEPRKASRTALLAAALDRVYPSMELWVAVRTAYLDAQVVRSEATQVVLLGAGLDSRAARLQKEGVRFFEVAHPSSQADKKQRLAGLPAYPLQAATHIACDFEMDDFLALLVDAGFRADEPALILWEGVTPYLQEIAVRAMLRDEALEKDDARAFVDGLGERVLWGTNDPLPLLYEEGFRHVRSLSFDEACLSLTGTYARDREFRFQRMVLASRTPTGII